MRFYSRQSVKPNDLNAGGTLFGGTLLAWIDQEAAIYARCVLNTRQIVTKYMSEIDFVSSAQQGDIIEIGIEVVLLGASSITLRCHVRNLFTHQQIITIEKMVFVHIDENGKAKAHGITEVPAEFN
jgi:acyl-CoA thioesterase YciA